MLTSEGFLYCPIQLFTLITFFVILLFLSIEASQSNVIIFIMIVFKFRSPLQHLRIGCLASVSRCKQSAESLILSRDDVIKYVYWFCHSHSLNLFCDIDIVVVALCVDNGHCVFDISHLMSFLLWCVPQIWISLLRLMKFILLSLNRPLKRSAWCFSVSSSLMAATGFLFHLSPTRNNYLYIIPKYNTYTQIQIIMLYIYYLQIYVTLQYDPPK